ncbi:UDP-N-acetyl-D-glucosamine 2-epimerase, UDP-hydrolysing [Thermoanaerobacterium xylanolyticum LX-11]|uniref:UDP-N-acetyl-D-glucosamine 2-epimerase, UDP-hydrolysing n=1 Tax=Thermoanaerobacterium xylanolyticum (strain ATCC 49914 / DSM 7097 / LX-11) TaxID=858215 RepID=F6BJ81_THEXL|nr:UDP-N-acetylglucosamine 2-epimerase [Thermoanaerobacterium xylanolyticum]AEF17898.1 UDP-N-acetyl-D-glucosamine 2-epimerase, UDP-hydrolysing [Thermoanaerobacterium xylanolyticum LX-11]
MKKIAVVTGTRAEYGLLYPLLKRIKETNLFDLQIIVTGMHLSPEFGLTFKEIIDDGFKINEKIEMLLSSDSEIGITKSIGLGIIGFADALNRLRPDIVILLGDRFETFAAAVACLVAKIPIAHLYGGELTEGLIDDAIRHSITKMSTYHFTSTEIYKNRVIQLGENPERVFNVGALGIDNIENIKLLSREDLQEELSFKLGEVNILVTYHPVTLENNTSQAQFIELLKALDSFENIKIIFTKPNADTDGRIISMLIDKYVKTNSDRAVSFTSLGRLKYLSLMKNVDVVLGNSSSGIIEAPTFKKPTVNIGDRQKGRIKAKSVIDCEANSEKIVLALKKALSTEFKKLCETIDNPYGDGKSSERIINILKKILDTNISIKKTFYDMVM